MRAVSRLRRVLVLIACVLVVAVLAGVSVVDPFHLRQARWFTSGLIALGLVLLTATLAVAAPRGGLRWLAVIVGVAAVLGWGALVFGASTLNPLGKDVSVEQVDTINEIAARHGFGLAGFRSFERAVDKEYIASVRRNAYPKK